VDGVYDLVAELNVSLQQLGTSLGGAANTLTDVQGALQTVVNTVTGVPIIGPILGEHKRAAKQGSGGSVEREQLVRRPAQAC
jgi:hypothetical protein